MATSRREGCLIGAMNSHVPVQYAFHRRGGVEKPPSKKKPLLLRARTLPAIICPSLNIIQAQLEANNLNGKTPERYLDPEAEFRSSPNGSPRPSVTSITSVTSTNSQQSTGRESSKQKHESTRAGFAKLARFLTSKEKSSNTKGLLQFPSTIPNIEVTPLRRSGSVDSLLDITNYQFDASDVSSCSSTVCLAPACSTSNLIATSCGRNLTVPSDGRPIPTSPSVPAKLEAHRIGDIPSSPSVPNRLVKGGSGTCLGSREVLPEGLPLSKTEKKRLEKVNKVSIDLQALFVSVEHEQLDRAKCILLSPDLNVNCVNGDGFTPLDIAVMTLDISMAKLLQSYGARESTRFRTSESRFGQLLNLLREAERCVEDLTTCVLNSATSGTLSMALLKEKEKQLSLWKRRHQLLSKMKSGFEKLGKPGQPSSVTLEVVGTKALKVKFTEPLTSNVAELAVTKYRVEWSCSEDFRPLSGAREIMNLQKLEVFISDLSHGVSYYVRVSAGNSKGYSQYTYAVPPCAAPSSWMDVDGRKPRSLGRLCQIDCVFYQIRYSRPPCSTDVKDLISPHSAETPQQQRRQMRKSIKNLFTSAPKFQKTMKRGVYLASLLYSEHRVLVTTEDTLPIMEVDDSTPGCIHNDFHWLMKVACTWEDVKPLRIEMTRSHSSSAVHFRSKLLQAAELMQVALGLQDLGQFYYKPLKDSIDTVVLCTVKYVADAKSLNNLSTRWIPLAKLQRKLSINNDMNLEISSINSLLLSSTQSMMTYNQVSCIPLPRGLYVAYIKISCSVDLIRVLVPRKAPNVLPYYRVRENPHVSREEWELIRYSSENRDFVASDAQLKFQKALSSAVRSLLSLLEITQEDAQSQRIYDAEVVELNADVSLILILPPVESVFAAPGQKDDIIDREDCMLLPLQIFEIIHMSTYQHTFISRYSRVSSILEMDTIVAQHVHRQAFSSSEVTSAKSRLRQLKEFQTQVDNTWRAMRWLMDVLNFAREKQPPGGVPLYKVLVMEVWSPVSSESPQYYPTRHTLKVPSAFPTLKPRGDDPIIIRINNSTSSFSLTESSNDYLSAPSEMRRCSSATGLHQVEKQGHLSSSGLAKDDQTKAYSIEGLSVSCQSDNETNDEICNILGQEASSSLLLKDRDVAKSDRHYKYGETFGENFVHKNTSFDRTGATRKEANVWSSPVSITRGSSRSLSSNDTTLPEVDEEEDDCYEKDEDEKIVKNHLEESSDESTDDGGLQFKDLPAVAEGEDDATNDEQFLLEGSSQEASQSGTAECVLRVRAAYDSGLPSNTSVRLLVTPDTSAREIVDAVIKQVNKAVLEKGERRPIYHTAKELDGFCLVVLLDSKERCLNDSFQPLKVQNPWTKGKLLVRRKSDLSGATSDI